MLLPLALIGIAASSELPWEEMTESDWAYALATRFPVPVTTSTSGLPLTQPGRLTMGCTMLVISGVR
jgi:hypothetical protein